MNGPLRVGLIGFGLAGSAFHAPLIAAQPRLALASVVTGSPERAKRVQTAHPDARVLPDPDALWAVAGEHDVVVIAAPNAQHVPLGLAALEAGLHVVIDKPLAPSVAGARLLQDAAAAAGRLVVPFHNRRWDADALTLRGLLAQEAMGRVLRFESSMERWRPQVDPERWRERRDPDAAGGVLFDLGPHLIDQALWLFGPAGLLHADLSRGRPGAQVDDDATLVLAHESGVLSVLRASLVTALPGPRMRVLGSDAAWVKHGTDPQEAALRGGADPLEDGFGCEPPESFGQLGDVDSGTTPTPSEPGRYLAFYERLAGAVAGNEPAPVQLEDALAGLELIEAARLAVAADGV